MSLLTGIASLLLVARRGRGRRPAFPEQKRQQVASRGLRVEVPCTEYVGGEWGKGGRQVTTVVGRVQKSARLRLQQRVGDTVR